MGAAAEPLLVTVEQYRGLPSRPDAVQELHWGEVVTLTFPKKQHTRIQTRLLDLLRSASEGKGFLAANSRSARFPSTIYGLPT
jgi:Uma2 family endonuclease